jgi:hypothetical protein
MTYVICNFDVEMYWPSELGPRNALTKCILPIKDDLEAIEELALWVWEKRFFNDGLAVILGGRLGIEILQVSFIRIGI